MYEKISKSKSVKTWTISRIYHFSSHFKHVDKNNNNVSIPDIIILEKHTQEHSSLSVSNSLP